MIEPWVVEWVNDPNKPIAIKMQINRKLVKKQKQVYMKWGLTY